VDRNADLQPQDFNLSSALLLMKKVFLSLAVLAALGYGGFSFWKKIQAQNHSSINSRATTAKVELRDIRLSINAAGEIGPADQVSVRPEVNGKVSVLSIDIGDQIKKGDLLFALDDSDLQTERASHLTEIEDAKLQVEKSGRNFERSKKLSADKLISQEVFDDAKTDFDMAQNTLEKAQKALAIVEEQLTKTKILAPFDCTVLTRPVSVGQAVSGSGGFNSGTEVMTIANLNDMIIMAHVNQADVTRLKNSQQVDIQVESVPGLKMKGTIERIAPQATIRNNLKGFDARILIKKIDTRVRPGMTANLSIPVVSSKDTLAVPLAAVFTEANAETKDMERFVYVKKDEIYERRLIQLGVSDNSFAEITDGLTSGEIVSLEEPPDGAEIKTATGKPRKKKSAKPVRAAAAAGLVPR